MRPNRFLWFLIMALGVSLWLACSDDTTGPPPPVQTVPDSVSFKNHIQPIFTSRCAISGCHVAPNPRAGLILTKGVAYANIVNVPSTAFSGMRVLPGDPSQSVLYLLVANGQMPQQGPHLTTVEVQTIQKWIVNDALDN